MKEKEASPRKTSTPRKSSKLALDVTIKTQMKKRADASRAAVKEKEETKKKEVTFADTVVEPDSGRSENQSFQEEPHNDPNTSVDFAREEDKENTALEGDEEHTQKEGDDAVEGSATHDDEDNVGEKDKDAEENKDAEDKKEDEDKHDDDKEDKKGKKGKKKGGKTKPKKEIKKKVEKVKQIEMPKGEVTAGTEEFRTFIFDKVQSALEIVCTDGVTETTVDNVTPLLKALDIDTSDEGVIDLMRDALVDNFGVINPLDLDQVVQKSQEADELNEMDDCLEVAFKLIDFDEDDFITQKDIYKLGLRLGEELAEFALDEMVDAVDMDKDGKISLRDFRYFLLGRDVPSRKEIFAMAEAARKKREEEEERKRQEEEKKENERQAKLYQKIKEGEVIGVEDAAEEERESIQDSEEGQQDEDKNSHDNSEVTVEETVEDEKPIEPKEPVPKTEAELLREKRKNMFAGYAKVVTAAKILSNGPEQKISEVSPRDDDNQNIENKTVNAENQKDDNVLGENNDGNSGFHDNLGDINDEDDHEFDRHDLGPLPLQTSLTLNLPPPDLSAVSNSLFSPVATPATSPRRPTIVGIGGLGVSHSHGNNTFTDAIQRLEEDMFRGDNAVPQRPRRRRSTCSSVDEPMIMNSANDVEDYNNRLVFKLPPLRRPSWTPPAGAQHQNNISSERRSSLQRTHKSNKCAMATDSDEGIDLADEELVEPTLIMPCGTSAPSVSLRISLPEGAMDYDADKMNVAIITRKGRRRSSASSTTINIDDRGVAMLGVGPYGDTPRSMSRSEMSMTHVSLFSPRLSDDEDHDVNDNDDLETTTSKAAVHTASNTSGYDCDGDSIVLSLNEDEHEVEDSLKANEKLSHYKKGRLKKTKLRASISPSQDRELSPTPSLTKRKSIVKSNKMSLSCQKIEIKELSLNEPVPVGQYSNRHKFGMIPRDVSRFIVLGKNPTTNEEIPDVVREDLIETQPKKSATVRWKELPDKIRPILKYNKEERSNTQSTPVKEHNVLQDRRLSLFHNFDSPMLKNRQSFDFPTLPNKIQIPTGNESSSSSNIPGLENIKKMERKILKRSQTSFELPNLYDGHSDGAETARSDISSKARRSSKSRPQSARRKSSPIVSYDSDGGGRYSSRNRKVSVVDLSKSLRRDSACKNTASLSKKHSGFKSIVPLARVVMAYQSTKKKREAAGFYSISRQLEKSGVPFNSSFGSSSSPRRNASDSIGANYRMDSKKRRCRSAKGRSSSGGGGAYTSSKNEVDDLFLPLYDDEIHTLVGDLKDPDALPAQVVFQKARPATAHAGIMRNVTNSNLSRSVSGSRSNIVTLEIPETNKFEKKLKNASLLSKLPIK